MVLARRALHSGQSKKRWGEERESKQKSEKPRAMAHRKVDVQVPPLCCPLTTDRCPLSAVRSPRPVSTAAAREPALNADLPGGCRLMLAGSDRLHLLLVPPQQSDPCWSEFKARLRPGCDPAPTGRVLSPKHERAGPCKVASRPSATLPEIVGSRPAWLPLRAKASHHSQQVNNGSPIEYTQRVAAEDPAQISLVVTSWPYQTAPVDLNACCLNKTMHCDVMT